MSDRSLRSMRSNRCECRHLFSDHTCQGCRQCSCKNTRGGLMRALTVDEWPRCAGPTTSRPAEHVPPIPLHLRAAHLASTRSPWEHVDE